MPDDQTHPAQTAGQPAPQAADASTQRHWWTWQQSRTALVKPGLFEAGALSNEDTTP